MKVFAKIDKNQDGVLSRAELIEGYEKIFSNSQ